LAVSHLCTTSLIGMALDQPSAALVIGHRGACGYRPEHTLASYALAVDLGADFIEPDLVSTRDGVLVARHENEIGGTTDVARRPEFAARRTTKVVDGTPRTGWFTEDFTLAELKTLRAVERIPRLRQGNTLYDGRFQVPTLQEVVDLAQQASERTGRTIGIYPETKLPSYFAGLGLALEEPLVDVLHRNGYRTAADPVFVQSFEVGNLRALAQRTSVRLVQLIAGGGQPVDLRASGDPRTYDDLASPAGLAEIASYASGIGPAKDRVIARTSEGGLGAPTALVDDAHRAGLLVHPYTFRNENTFLPADLRLGRRPTDYGHAFAEYRAFWAAGVDGLFSDNPDTARLARDEQLLEAAPAA
jgi:glycerophosphoryl diester phosphodiesterase